MRPTVRFVLTTCILLPACVLTIPIGAPAEQPGGTYVEEGNASNTIETTGLTIPYLARPVFVAIDRTGQHLTGVGLGNPLSGPDAGFYAYSDDDSLGLLQVFVRDPQKTGEDGYSRRVSVTVQGQNIVGYLYIGPVKDRNGSLHDPRRMLGEYLRVTGDKQAFIYDKRKRRGTEKERAMLFAHRKLSTNAKATQVGEYRWNVVAHDRQVKAGEVDHGSGRGRLTFGRMIEPQRQRYHEWIFNDSGVVD